MKILFLFFALIIASAQILNCYEVEYMAAKIFHLCFAIFIFLSILTIVLCI